MSKYQFDPDFDKQFAGGFAATVHGDQNGGVINNHGAGSSDGDSPSKRSDVAWLKLNLTDDVIARLHHWTQYGSPTGDSDLEIDCDDLLRDVLAVQELNEKIIRAVRNLERDYGNKNA
jgi:hypothetical protein